MKSRFNVKIGLSDHTLGITLPVVATTLGAKVIEKHFIIDKTIGGHDAAFSLDLNEFSAMVKAVREAEEAIGVVDYSLTPKQLKGRDFCRSLYLVEDIKAGEKFTEKNVRSIRPGYGISPKYYNDILGGTASMEIKAGTPINWNLIE